MGRFYDMFYKREPVQDVVHVTLPPGFATPHGYGALMSIDFAACEQTKARSMASLPFSVMQAGRDGHKRLDNHPLAKILNGMANEEMTAAKLMDWTPSATPTGTSSGSRENRWRSGPSRPA